ncbi:MAG: YicC family protein [Pseudomonadota bacterium]|nr:YicC family protein [Pseudomonadota bacterium]
MIKSMTAFARRELKGNSGALTCELRSVNHRYLDISLRLPDELRGLENAMREKTSRAMQRGKLECQLRYQPADGAPQGLVVNEALVHAVIDATHRIESLMTNPARMTAIDLLRWPGVVCELRQDSVSLAEEAAMLFEAVLKDLIDSRIREGARIEELIKERCAAIRNIVALVRQRRPQVLAAIREKYLARIEELGVQADVNRLEQELALIAQKLDVDEELDRLDGHLDEVGDVLSRTEAVGRRLDFLMQECNREANTLSAKSADLATTQASVELKVLIEQMREQVQNIE